MRSLSHPATSAVPQSVIRAAAQPPPRVPESLSRPHPAAERKASPPTSCFRPAGRRPHTRVPWNPATTRIRKRADRRASPASKRKERLRSPRQRRRAEFRRRLRRSLPPEASWLQELQRAGLHPARREKLPSFHPEKRQEI